MKRTPIKRRTRVRAQSERRQQLAEARRVFVALVLQTHPYCQVRWDGKCQAHAIDVHEPLSRARGGSILDWSNALSICRYCHSMVHDHPAEATERGFLRSAWE